MVTALGSDTDRIVGLEVGADDYLPKPFNPRELLARIMPCCDERKGAVATSAVVSGIIFRSTAGVSIRAVAS